MILIESPGPVPRIYIKYMNEEGFKVSARPILVLTCLVLKMWTRSQNSEIIKPISRRLQKLELKEIFTEVISYDGLL